MNPRFRTIMIPTLSAFAGGALVFGAMKLTSARKVPVEVEEARAPKIRPTNVQDIWEDMDRRFKEQEQSIEARFAAEHQEISQREDEDFVYFDLKVEDPTSTALKTEVADGHLIISGSTEKKNDSDETESFYKSTFTRSFPLPENVDAAKMEMQNEPDKIVLKFPKLKA